MKRKLISLFFLALITIAACDKSEDRIPPTIILVKEAGYVSGDTSLAGGDEFKVKVKLLKGDLNITNFLINVYSDTMSRYFDTGMNTDYLIWSGTYLKTLSAVENWTLMASDRESNTTAIGFKIFLDTAAQYTPLLTYPSLVLGAQDNQIKGGCYDIASNSIFSHTEVAGDTALQKGIDILYFFDPDDNNTLASPGANISDGIFTVNPSSWTYINTTRYIKTSLGVEDFDVADNDSIVLANFNEGEAKRKAKNLKTGDIYTFRTHDGRLGIFKVTEVSGSTEGSVNISLKIQQ